MKPEVKARQLVAKFSRVGKEYQDAITDAIICVEEIIDAIDWHEFETPNKEFEYWQEVLTHIKNL